jgi:hypothetical protein
VGVASCLLRTLQPTRLEQGSLVFLWSKRHGLCSAASTQTVKEFPWSSLHDHSPCSEATAGPLWVGLRIC